jgi:ABC-type phosphate/phosphonate transport system substrate-binding protein
MKAVLAIASLAVPSALAAAPAKPLFVVCSPGSPGTTAEAQPTMDLFAAALSAKAGLSVAAVYDETEEAGVARLRGEDAAAALVSLPFYLKHERDLALRARLQAVSKGRPELEVWTLVAKKGRVATPAALDGFTLVSNAGFAPAFVRGPALGGYGPLPASVRVVASGNVLSALRRAAAGEQVAVLVDGTQQAALASLPFASELEAVTRSQPLPAGVVAAVDGRLAPKTWSAVENALLALASDESGARALDALQTARFAPLDERALTAARKAYADAAR